MAQASMSAMVDALGKGGMGGELQHAFEFGLANEIGGGE
jgi:hypothetical protein